MKELAHYAFHSEYRSGRDDLVAGFYHPALARSERYWRAVGFFSSTSFEAVGQPLADFVRGGGRMRLITSVHLEEEDYDAIQQGLDRREAYERRLLKQLDTEFDPPFGDGAAMLTSLLETGRLEIRIVTPRHGFGIYHEKVGIFLDGTDSFVAFSGSSNESRTAFESNYECVDIFTSWEEPARALAKKSHFEQLWEGSAPGAETFEFPEAVRRELIRKNADRGNGLPRAAAPPEDKWRHQEQAIQAVMRHERGILEMATGTGKTRTALQICQRLLDAGQIGTIIVAATGNDLLDQWYSQLLQATKSFGVKMTIRRDYHERREGDGFLLMPAGSILLSSRENLRHTLACLPEAVAEKTVLIHDEVHGLGSPDNVKALEGASDRIRYRIGLSATPEREYDAAGTAFIERHVGPVLFQFGLAEAIDREILAPFNYYPLEYAPDQDDRERIRAVHRLAAAKRAHGETYTKEQLWMDLARVYKTSRAKLPLFRDFIQDRPELLRRCIIFVETREYGEDVLAIVHRHRHDFRTYYSKEDNVTLRRFARGDIECLITCHRLSEGIDIQSIGTVVLFSAARARLESIQRIGRCLRLNPEEPEKRANVVDFIRAQSETSEEENPDQQRRAWLEGLSGLRPITGAL